MKILFLENGMHQKNVNALYKYNNNYYVAKSIEEIDNIDLNQFDCIYSPCVPLNVKKYPNAKFIFGPHFSVFPELHQMNEIRNNNVIYIQPSEWAAKVWENHPYCENIKVKVLPFGVDTNKFCDTASITDRNKVFIYFKNRSPEDLNLVTNFLNNKNIPYVIFSYKNRYNEQEYINYLQNSKFGVWLGGHESQGFALQEALSSNVPLLVWSVKSMKQEYGSTYDDIHATTIPYWDERCGEYFYNFDELENTFDTFVSKIETYKPREYILENLSIKKCEEKLKELINNF
jgi:glycosyltransferase involved in cell wall biosynthesis